MLIIKQFYPEEVDKGGAGSGNFGHAGIPGDVGGAKGQGMNCPPEGRCDTSDKELPYIEWDLSIKNKKTKLKYYDINTLLKYLVKESRYDENIHNDIMSDLYGGEQRANYKNEKLDTLYINLYEGKIRFILNSSAIFIAKNLGYNEIPVKIYEEANIQIERDTIKEFNIDKFSYLKGESLVNDDVLPKLNDSYSYMNYIMETYTDQQETYFFNKYNDSSKMWYLNEFDIAVDKINEMTNMEKSIVIGMTRNIVNKIGANKVYRGFGVHREEFKSKLKEAVSKGENFITIKHRRSISSWSEDPNTAYNFATDRENERLFGIITKLDKEEYANRSLFYYKVNNSAYYYEKEVTLQGDFNIPLQNIELVENGVKINALEYSKRL